MFRSRGLEHFQRGAVSVGGFFQQRYVFLLFAKLHEHISQVVLRRRPVEGNALSGTPLEHVAVGGDGFLQPCGVLLLFAKLRECEAELELRLCPAEGVVGSSLTTPTSFPDSSRHFPARS